MIVNQCSRSVGVGSVGGDARLDNESKKMGDL